MEEERRPHDFYRVFTSGDSVDASKSGSGNARQAYFTLKLKGNASASDDMPLIGLTEDFEVAVLLVIVHNTSNRTFPFLLSHNLTEHGIQYWKRRASASPIAFLGVMNTWGVSAPSVPTYSPIKSTDITEVTFRLRDINDTADLGLGNGRTSVVCHFRPRGDFI